MNVEGIIIQKTPYKERDVICNLLLRSGKCIAVYFYGGRGGGKSTKGSILELGFMVKIELAQRRKKIDTDIQIAKDYKLIWDGGKIRDDFKAFYLLSFFLEYTSKISPSDNLHEGEIDHHEGVFNALSNSLFYLNKSIEDNCVDYKKSLFVFLVKLCFHSGVNPEAECCSLCNIVYKIDDLCLLDYQLGGFICYDCSSKKDEYLSQNRLELENLRASNLLRVKMMRTLGLSFRDFYTAPDVSALDVASMFNYLNFQFGFSKDQIKTWQMVSSY